VSDIQHDAVNSTPGSASPTSSREDPPKRSGGGNRKGVRPPPTVSWTRSCRIPVSVETTFQAIRGPPALLPRLPTPTQYRPLELRNRLTIVNRTLGILLSAVLATQVRAGVDARPVLAALPRTAPFRGLAQRDATPHADRRLNRPGISAGGLRVGG